MGADLALLCLSLAFILFDIGLQIQIFLMNISKRI